jgi:hypothetical protein
MTELQTLIEMQETIPVPPQQIIEKMDLSATEKERWIEYINQQQQSQSQEQEEMKQVEIGFKDREIKVDEQKNVMDFMVDLAKIKQMSEKDEKAMITKFKGMEVQEQSTILGMAKDFITQAADSDDEGKAEQDMELDARAASQDLAQDSAESRQDLQQSNQKHEQDIKFVREKNAVLLKVIQAKAALELKTAEAKAELDLKTAKAKAEQDIEIAKTKAAQMKAQGGDKKDGGKPSKSSDDK